MGLYNIVIIIIFILWKYILPCSNKALFYIFKKIQLELRQIKMGPVYRHGDLGVKSSQFF